MCSDLDERNRVLCTRLDLGHTHRFFDDLVIIRDVFSIDGLLEWPCHFMRLETAEDGTSHWCKRFFSLPKVVRWDSIHPFVVRRWSVDWEILVSSPSSISDTHRLRICLLLPVWDSHKHRATNLHRHHNRCRIWKMTTFSSENCSLARSLLRFIVRCLTETIETFFGSLCQLLARFTDEFGDFFGETGCKIDTFAM